MRFLLDAQLSRQLVVNLVRSGHEASHVFDHLAPEADDAAIAAIANRIGASVVSKDADFADLAVRGQLTRTLVWLRIPNLANDLLWARLEQALPAVVAADRINQQVVEVF